MTQTNKVPMPRPNTDLDFQAQLTDPFTSSEYVNPNFSNKFKDIVYFKDETTGEVQAVVKRDLWAILQIFNRDWRLGNIDKKEEAVFIRYNIDLCADILNLLGDDFKQPALICFERALCVNETSQSKGGFLRRMLNTFIHKTNNNNEQPKKSGFLSFAKKNKGGY